MEHARLEIRLIPNETLSVTGAESVQFFFPAQSRSARWSLIENRNPVANCLANLAIQVITATRLATPTLVFDEVDVGLAEKLLQSGELLTDLAVNAQVLVVTHQPQVAGQADQHLHVQKQSDDDVTVSQACLLSRSERIDEIKECLAGTRLLNVRDKLQQICCEIKRRSANWLPNDTAIPKTILNGNVYC